MNNKIRIIEYINENGVILGSRIKDNYNEYFIIYMFNNYDHIVVNKHEFMEYLDYLRQYNKMYWLVHGTNIKNPA